MPGKIPKIIHFVWAGGSKHMPMEPNLTVVKAWARAHPDFKICIWVDRQTSDVTTMNEYYSSAFEGTDMAVRPLSEAPIERDSDEGIVEDITSSEKKIVLMDIEECHVSCPEVRYEIDRLRPNYGASSDMLRYGILRLGGAYFDSDVYPNPDIPSPLSTLRFDEERDGDVLYVDINSQLCGLVGNDAFVCTPHNPLMAEILETARGSYSEENCRLFDYDTYQDRSDSTPVHTGPKLIRRLVCETLERGGRLKDEAFGSQVRVLASEGRRLMFNDVRRRNDNAWLHSPYQRVAESDVALRSIRSAVQFESVKLRLLRKLSHEREFVESLLRGRFYTASDVSQEDLDGLHGEFAEQWPEVVREIPELDRVESVEAMLLEHLDQFLYTEELSDIKRQIAPNTTVIRQLLQFRDSSGSEDEEDRLRVELPELAPPDYTRMNQRHLSDLLHIDFALRHVNQYLDTHDTLGREEWETVNRTMRNLADILEHTDILGGCFHPQMVESLQAKYRDVAGRFGGIAEPEVEESDESSWGLSSSE